MLPTECKSDWKGSIRMLVHVYNCTHNSAMGFSSYLLMHGRQVWLPINVTLGITPKLITMPTSSIYFQKLRDHFKWAYRKVNLFQQKEAQCHKWNFDIHSEAVSLRMGDMVTVHITAFKGRYEMQIRWENREYVMEQQPYPNLPIYVVTSYRWGRVQPYPTQKLPVAHQQQSGTGGRWKPCGGTWIQWETNSSTTWEWCIASQLPNWKSARRHA